MTHRCPTCERLCTPVYCRASTPEQPLLLAYTVEQAARRLGIFSQTIYATAEPWQGGLRLRGRKRRAA